MTKNLILVTVVILSSCVTSRTRKVENFHERIELLTRLGMPHYVVMPILYKNEKREICLESKMLQSIYEIELGNQISQDSFSKILKRTLDSNRSLLFTHQVRDIEYYGINDLFYESFNKMSINSFLRRYIDTGKSWGIRDEGSVPFITFEQPQNLTGLLSEHLIEV